MITAAEFVKWCEIFGVQYGSHFIPTPVAMGLGGTGASLTPSNGSLFYSTAAHGALLPTADNGVLVTGAGGLPSISSTLPSGLTIPGYLPLSGGTMLGILNAGGYTIEAVDNPVFDMDAVNLQYLNGTAVLLSGSTMSGYLTLVGSPVSGAQAATKNYVDLVAGGLVPSGPVDAASTTDFDATYFNGSGNDGIGATLTAVATGTVTLDGVLTVINDDYLFKDQTNPVENGIYTCTTAGAIGVAAVFTRSTSYDTPADINATGIVPVIGGNTQNGFGYYQINSVSTIGFTDLVYTQFGNSGTVTSVTAGTGLAGGIITMAGTVSLTIPVVPTHGGTGLTSVAANSLLYASSANTWAALTTGNNSVLSTDGSGVPSWSTTLPSGLSATNMTLVTPALGTPTALVLTSATGLPLTTGVTGILPLANGGTNANLTASAGGIFYSSGSAAAILAGTASPGLPLLSGSSAAPTWGAYALNLGGVLTTAAALSFVGAYSATLTFTGATNVTFPTSGTLATTSALPTPAALTKTDDTNVTLTLGGTPSTALLQATSLTLGWTGELSLGRGGSNANLTASNGGIVYSTASAMAILAGTATASQLLLSGASGSPSWSTTTYPATNAINTLLYASSANVMAALATGNNSVLGTNGSGVPSWSTTLPSGLSATNMTLITPALGTPTALVLTSATGLPLTTGVTGILPLANGGTNANLTASNGGIFYSTASAAAILSNTGTANQMLQSGALGAPAWSTTTYPATNAINTLLYASSANVMAALATQNSSVLSTNGSGVPSWSTTLPSGLSATNMTLVTPALGTPTALVLTSATGLPLTTGVTGILPLANGGTNANLTASNGGIFYSSGSAAAILAGTATAGQILRSGANTQPSWSTATYPATAGTNGNVLTSDGTNWNSSPAPTPTLEYTPACFGRLTLTSNLAVTTTDVTAATTLYFTPFLGNFIDLYDGVSAWTRIAFTQFSIAVPATTNQMYDVWVYNSSGTPTLELLAWTNDTTRATGLGTQNGVYVKVTDSTRRYVGSFRTTGVSGQTEDSYKKRFLWNYYNRVEKGMFVNAASTSWTYTTSTLRQANGSTANQLALVTGISEDVVPVTLQVQASNGIGNANFYVVLGLDTTTAEAAIATHVGAGAANGDTLQKNCSASFVGYSGIGYHYIAWLESSDATGTTSWNQEPSNGGGLTGRFKC